MISIKNESNIMVIQPKHPQSLMSRLISSSLNLVLRSLTEEPTRYTIVFNVLSEFNVTDDTMVCTKLD